MHSYIRVNKQRSGREADGFRDFARSESARAESGLARGAFIRVDEQRPGREADGFRDFARPESARAESGLAQKRAGTMTGRGVGRHVRAAVVSGSRLTPTQFSTSDRKAWALHEVEAGHDSGSEGGEGRRRSGRSAPEHHAPGAAGRRSRRARQVLRGDFKAASASFPAIGSGSSTLPTTSRAAGSPFA